MYKDRKRINKNGYIVVEYPDHPKAFDTGTGLIGVYEHVLICEEEVIDRPLKLGEHVHHLDKNKSNNSPDNLLVLENPMHGKLHAWLNKHNIIPTPEYQKRTELGCIRCKICERPIRCGDVYCSSECLTIGNRKHKPVTKEELEKMVWEKPTVHIAKDLNVSDVAVGKLCKRLDVEKPPRGYWAKKKAEEDTVLFRIKL